MNGEVNGEEVIVWVGGGEGWRFLVIFGYVRVKGLWDYFIEDYYVVRM